MSASRKLWVGIACLVIISFVAYSYIANHNNSETNNITTIPPNATNVAANLHHYQVKVNELINVGERTK